MIDKKNIKNIYEMTPLQEGMFFHSLYDSESSAYFEQTRDRIIGCVDTLLFEKSWQALVLRHDIFRTLFVNHKQGKLLQIVLKDRSIPFLFQDLRGEDEVDQQRYCDDFAETDKSQLFDLGKDPLMRVALFQLDDTTFEMIWSMHHILLDAWSLNIIQRELLQVYTAFKDAKPTGLVPAVPFSHYVRWLKQQNKSEAKDYWKSYLKGYTKPACLPQKERQKSSSFHPETHVFHLSEELSQSLRGHAAQKKTSLPVLLQAAWGVLVSAISDQMDSVFALTVSGRPAEIEGIENMVGLFINAIPVRVEVGQQSFNSLLDEMHASDANGKPYHYHSLAEIQATSALKQALFDHILVLETAPEDTEEAFNTGFKIVNSTHFDHTNYDLTVQIVPSQRIHFTLIYNSAAYETVFMNSMESRVVHLLQVLLSQSEEQISTLSVLPNQEQALYKKNLPEAEELTVVASFTSEPLAPSFNYWMSEFNLSMAARFADYNQVFQQLLNPESLLHQNSGISCLLIRFEDWIRDQQQVDVTESLQLLESSFAQLKTAFNQHPRLGTWYVGIFPPTPYQGLTSQVLDYIKELNQQWDVWLKGKSNVRVFNTSELAQSYAVEELFDEHSDNSGHIPFSNSCYAAIGTFLARQCVALKMPPFKVIVLDCDNTLWKGVCGEDGVRGIQISEPYQKLQRTLIDKYEQGFLLALCSKNNEADVWEVFNENPDMILKPEHIVAYRINWQPKSGNLKSLAQELNLGLDSFMFLDDSGIECSEVMSFCPEVLTLQVPQEASAISEWLTHIWALDRIKVTSEDMQRTALYQAEKKRRQKQTEVVSLDDFLESLEVSVTMSRCQEFQIGRLSQLTQRTNQFNLNGLHLTESEISMLISDPNHVCWTIQVDDKFGQYGVVGLLISEKKDGHLFISHFLLSCRVLGRSVDQAVMYGVRRHAEALGISSIVADYRVKDRNTPLLSFLESTGWQPASKGTYQIDVTRLPSVLNNIIWKDKSPIQQKSNSPIVPAVASISEKSGLAQRHDWPVLLVNDSNLKHFPYYQALKSHRGNEIGDLARSNIELTAEYEPYIAASNPVQEKLLALWELLLNQSGLGINDDFFKLGGHSLLAVQLVSRVKQLFGVDVALHVLFENPTVSLFSGCIYSQQVNSASKHCVVLQRGHNASTPIFLLPGYTGSVFYLHSLARALGNTYTVYALENPGFNKEGSIPETLEDLALFHLDAVRKIQAKGPYRFLGHSIGGIVSFEMASQLENTGEEVDVLGVVDIHAPGIQVKSEAYSQIYFLRELIIEIEQFTGISLNVHLDNTLSSNELMNKVWVVMTKKNLYAGGIDEFKDMMSVRQKAVSRYINYKPKKKIKSPVFLFHASETKQMLDGNEASDRGWKSFTSSKVEDFEVEGEHTSILFEPNVKTIASSIHQYINKI